VETRNVVAPLALQLGPPLAISLDQDAVPFPGRETTAPRSGPSLLRFGDDLLVLIGYAVLAEQINKKLVRIVSSLRRHLGPL
jgi:hypothetical protein